MLNLTCVVTGHVTAAAHIHWFRGAELLNTAARGGVNILSDKVSTSRGTHFSVMCSALIKLAFAV